MVKKHRWRISLLKGTPRGLLVGRLDVAEKLRRDEL
jgi:hypothetical protein